MSSGGGHGMKTMKWLKISVILQIVYVFFCISSISCFAITRYFDVNGFFALGNILIYGWIINPTGFVTLIVGFIFFFAEKGIEEYRKTIGDRWIWFILFFVFDILLYLVSAYFLVFLTGGV